MGASKTSEYTEKEIALANYAKALSHPARIAILNLLVKIKEKLFFEIRALKCYTKECQKD